MRDLDPQLYKITDENRDEALSRNENAATHRSLLLLYARYFCFRVYLQCADEMDGGITENHKGRWLLIQVAPVKLLVLSDIFIEVSRLAGGASFEYLEKAIRLESYTIHKLIPQPTLFCVLDEAQVLTKDLDHFRSKANPVQRRPILRPIVLKWGNVVENLIVSGTGISMREMEPVLGSAVGKHGRTTVTVTEIGGFDDEDGRRAYLERYFPPGFLDTSKGKEIVSRVGYWLRGRFVFNALSDKRLLIKSIGTVLLQLTSNAFSGPASSPPIKY